MASMKYFRVIKYIGSVPNESRIVMACNYIEARDKGKQLMPADVTYDSFELDNEELTEFFANENKPNMG